MRFLNKSHHRETYSLDHMQLVSIDGKISFIQYRDGPYLPTLRILHKCIYLVLITCILMSAFRSRNDEQGTSR